MGWDKYPDPRTEPYDDAPVDPGAVTEEIPRVAALVPGELTAAAISELAHGLREAVLRRDRQTAGRLLIRLAGKMTALAVELGVRKR